MTSQWGFLFGCLRAVQAISTHDLFVKKTMNFKMKFAAVAALSVMLAAPAFAEVKYEAETIAITSADSALAYANVQLVGSTFADDFGVENNAAFITQEGGSSVAYIDQVVGATLNLAMIIQGADSLSSLAVIHQAGAATGNRAVIYQH